MISSTQCINLDYIILYVLHKIKKLNLRQDPILIQYLQLHYYILCHITQITVFKVTCFVSKFIGEKEYYERQFATLKSFEEVDSIVVSDSIDIENMEKQAQHELAMKISNYANAVLLALKVIFLKMFIFS